MSIGSLLSARRRRGGQAASFAGDHDDPFAGDIANGDQAASFAGGIANGDDVASLADEVDSSAGDGANGAEVESLAARRGPTTSRGWRRRVLRAGMEQPLTRAQCMERARSKRKLVKEVACPDGQAVVAEVFNSGVAVRNRGGHTHTHACTQTSYSIIILDYSSKYICRH